MKRVSARRAASIWRAVTRSGSSAFRPYWPKDSVAPLVATPWMRPLKALRNLVRFGCSMIYSVPLSVFTARTAGFAFGEFLVLRHWVVFEDLTLEDPDFDAAGSVGGESGGDAVVDVGAQRMQRHATFAVPLHAGDFRTAEAAGAVDADT